MFIGQRANTLILTIRTLYLIGALKLMKNFSLLIIFETATGFWCEIFSLTFNAMFCLIHGYRKCSLL